MAISIDHLTRVIFIPQADLTATGPNLFHLDVNDLRLWLKDWEDSEQGIQMPNTHNHYPEVTLAGVTLARVVEIINGYTITFENGLYAVELGGANNNVGEVANVNSVSIRSNNSAGLTAAADPQDIADAVFGNVVENSITLQEAMRLVMAMLFGKVQGAGTGTEHFRDMADTKDRAIVPVDEDGNRGVPTLNPS